MGDNVLFYVGAATQIEHIYQLLSDRVNEGSVTSKFETIHYEWHDGGPIETMGTYTNTSNGVGRVQSNSPELTIPAGPSGVAPAGWIYEDYYRTVMDATANIEHNGGADNRDWSWSTVYVVDSPNIIWSPLWDDTHYTSVSSGIEHTGITITEYTENTVVKTRSVTDRITRYYEEIDDENYDGYDAEGETFHFWHDDWATNYGPGRVCSSSMTVHSLYQERRSYNDNIGDWDDVLAATEGYEVDTGYGDAVRSRVDTATWTTWQKTRVFYSFQPRSDLTSFDDRTITSMDLRIDSAGTGTPEPLVLQEGTQVGSGGTLVTDDFNNFTGGLLSTVISGWTNGDYNTITLNSGGSTFVENNIVGQSDIKFCFRDYNTDYLGGSVGTPSYDANMYFGANSVLARNPKLFIRYMKVPEWTDHTFDWSSITGSYSNGKWHSAVSGPYSTIYLDVSGSWATGYRPVAVRFTFGGVATMDVAQITEEYDEYEIIDEADYVSETIVLPNWQRNDTDGDIGKLYFRTPNSETFWISKIEFLEP